MSRSFSLSRALCPPLCRSFAAPNNAPPRPRLARMRGFFHTVKFGKLSVILSRTHPHLLFAIRSLLSSWRPPRLPKWAPRAYSIVGGGVEGVSYADHKTG